ncbi:MAG: SWIM zinc finger family protein [Euryarchaeota archaeon]|nr:SWIM zinc finger family protein [Euryarchaeota archaeon]
MRYWEYYTPAKPKRVKDGIKLRSREIGSTWWSKKWLSVLESFGWSNRLQRGRSYARRGQVIDFKIKPGIVNAKVQGTSPKPYSVRIKLNMLSDKQWKDVISVMSSQAIYTAKLLSGEMPLDVENAFLRAKVNLLPKSRKELKTECSCPDLANPCKHIAAVHYILAEEFDRDPFMIFHLRGRAKQQILAELHKMRTSNAVQQKENKESVNTIRRDKKDSEIIVPLEKCIDKFWSTGERFNTFGLSICQPSVNCALLKRLGAPTFWREKPDFATEMERIYKMISDRAIKTAFEV